MNGLDLKWVGEGGALRLRLSVPGVSALYPVADLIEMLKANPEACAEVLDALEPPRGGASFRDMEARAEQAERERGEARAELSAWHNIARSVGFAHEPYTGPVVVDAAARGAFADWCERNKEAVDGRAAAVDRLKYERDALKAKLAEAERSFAGYNAKLHAEALRENDVLRSRLAACEKVVEAARRWSECVERGFMSAERPDVARAKVLTALRAYDKTPGSSSGLPDAPDAAQATARPEHPNDSREDGGGHGPPREHSLPAARADLSALEERIVERVARAASVSDRQRYANDVNTHPMSRLADELRRKP